MMQKGNKGYSVGIVQIFLKSLGYYSGKIDNDFGAVTEAAVKNYQKNKKIVIDGIVGSQTVTSFFKYIKLNLKNGSTGETVDKYMGLLTKLGLYNGKMDKKFGPLMEKSVRRYQADKGLVIDGIIGNITGKSLLEWGVNQYKNTTSQSTSTIPKTSTNTNISTPENLGDYKIYYLDRSYGGNILLNPEISDNIPMTPLFTKIVEMSKTGRVIIELGEGGGETLMIAACIHGNEEEASIAAMKYLESVKDKQIKGKLYIIPFAFPQNTEKNLRFYTVSGKSYDPNRTVHIKGSPGYNILQFAKNKGIKRLIDNHSGGDVPKEGYIFYRWDAETKWYNYIKSKSECTGEKIGTIKGSIRRVANDYDISCITLEVERDRLATNAMALVNYKMLAAAMKYYGFP